MEETRKEQRRDSEETQREELLKRIEKSSETVRIPAALEPEAVVERLRAENKRVHRTMPVRRLANAAAVVVLVAAMGGVGIYGAKAVSGRKVLPHMQNQSDAEQQASLTESDEHTAMQVSPKKKAVVGSYRIASNYEEILAAVEYAEQDGRFYLNDYVFPEEPMDAGMAEPGAIGKDLAATDSSGLAQNRDQAADHSNTNLQVDGVDESDFVKNDGSYLYVQSGEEIHITDIRGERMKEAAVIRPELGTGDSICDMYVDGDRLFLIIQRREAKVEEGYLRGATDEVRFDGILRDGCFFYQTKDLSTELQTYDISDRGAGRLLGTVSQDGSYYSSRKVGDYVYLFSRKTPFYDCVIPYDLVVNEAWETSEIPETESEGQKDDSDVIPYINGSLARADCIYLREDAGNELIISSVNINTPDAVVDYMVLMDNWGQLYMSTDAVYLYSENWEWSDDDTEGRSYTEITKFSYRDGVLNGVGAVTVRGTIQDTFAISEGNGVLRVLTTEWSENSENRLYLLDENLKELGVLENIARGEEIYAARCLGNIAYFITYHNTDPLFAVDISDPRSPKMLGQLEITGFSDYLHPYGDGLLLGIGYETDPETSERLGVKLVMFDISDPVNLKILDTVTLDVGYTMAADYYKSVLADTDKNLIGFESTSWKDDESTMSYHLYSWQDGRFVRLMEESIDMGHCWDNSRVRGLYAGQRFYLLNPWDEGYQLRSYDMEGQFCMLDELKLD